MNELLRCLEGDISQILANNSLPTGNIPEEVLHGQHEARQLIEKAIDITFTQYNKTLTSPHFDKGFSFDSLRIPKEIKTVRLQTLIGLALCFCTKSSFNDFFPDMYNNLHLNLPNGIYRRTTGTISELQKERFELIDRLIAANDVLDPLKNGEKAFTLKEENRITEEGSDPYTTKNLQAVSEKFHSLLYHLFILIWEEGLDSHAISKFRA